MAQLATSVLALGCCLAAAQCDTISGGLQGYARAPSVELTPGQT